MVFLHRPSSALFFISIHIFNSAWMEMITVSPPPPRNSDTMQSPNNMRDYGDTSYFQMTLRDCGLGRQRRRRRMESHFGPHQSTSHTRPRQQSRGRHTKTPSIINIPCLSSASKESFLAFFRRIHQYLLFSLPTRERRLVRCLFIFVSPTSLR